MTIDARSMQVGAGLQVGAGPNYPLELAGGSSDLLKTHSKGSFSAFSTSSTSYVNVTGAAITKDTQAAKNAVIFEFPIDNSANEYALQLLIDGVAQTDSQFQDASLTDNSMVYYYFLTDALAAGSRVFQLQAKSVTGGAINLGAGNMMVYELDTNFDGYRTRFSAFNTTSTSYVDVTGASVSQTTRTHKVFVNAIFPMNNGTSGYAIQLMLNGVAVASSELTEASVQKNGIVGVNWLIEGVPNGANTFKLQIKRTSGASTLTLGDGNFTVIEQSESLDQETASTSALSTVSSTYVNIGTIVASTYGFSYLTGLEEVAAVTGETTVPGSSDTYTPAGARKIFVAGTGSLLGLSGTNDLKVKYDGASFFNAVSAVNGPQVGIAAAGLVTVSAGAKSVSSSFTKNISTSQLLQYGQLFWNIDDSIYSTQESASNWSVNSPTPSTLVTFSSISVASNDRIFVFGAGSASASVQPSNASNITFEYDGGSPTTFLDETYSKSWSNAEQKPTALAALTPALAAGTYTVRQKANSNDSTTIASTIWNSGIIVIPASIPAAETSWTTTVTAASQTKSCTINASGTRKILIGVSHSFVDVASYQLDIKFDGSIVKTINVGTYSHISFSLHVIDVPSSGNHTIDALFTVSGSGTYSGAVFAFELELGTISSGGISLDTTEDKAMISFSAPVKNLNSDFALRLLQNGTEIANSETISNSANESGFVTISGIATGLTVTQNSFTVQAKRTSGTDSIQFSAGKLTGIELPDYQRVNPGFLTYGDTIKMSHSKDGLLIGTGERLSAASVQNNDAARGFMGIPRMTATERTDFTTTYALGALHEGLFIFNLTTGKLNFWNGTAWEVVTSA